MSPSDASNSDFPLLALAGGAGTLILFALLGLAAVRLRHGVGQRRRSAPLWQGTAGIEASPVARLQHYADVDVSLTQPSRFVKGDVERRSAASGSKPRSQRPRDLRALAYRMRHAISSGDTAPVLVGSIIAIVAALLIIYLAG